MSQIPHSLNHTPGAPLVFFSLGVPVYLVIRVWTIEVDDVAIYLAALVSTEKGTQNGDYATWLAKQF